MTSLITRFLSNSASDFNFTGVEYSLLTVDTPQVHASQNTGFEYC
jgi:hypothetical protein